MWTEEPDVICVRFAGHVYGKALRQMLDYRNVWARGRERYFLLASMGAITGVDSEARRVMVEERAIVDRRQISIYFGASFGVRVIAQMMFRSLRVLRPGVQYSERIFLATEDEARTFVEERRRAMIAEARGHT